MNLPKQNRPILRIPAPIQGEKGLGDVVKRMTGKLGLHHCGSCERRAALLNRRVVFRPIRPR